MIIEFGELKTICENILFVLTAHNVGVRIIKVGFGSRGRSLGLKCNRNIKGFIGELHLQQHNGCIQGQKGEAHIGWRGLGKPTLKTKINYSPHPGSEIRWEVGWESQRASAATGTGALSLVS